MTTENQGQWRPATEMFAESEKRRDNFSRSFVSPYRIGRNRSLDDILISQLPKRQCESEEE